jgi:hypothetical protein
MAKTYKNDLDAPVAHDALSQRVFSAKDIKNVSYRMLHYWHSEGFLLRSQAPGEHRKFDLYELIWVSMIEEFRSMGVEVKNIVESIKDEFTKWINDNSGHTITKWIDGEPVEVTPPKFNYAAYFVIAVMTSIDNRDWLNLRVYKGGKCEVSSSKETMDEETYWKATLRANSESYIQVSITDVVAGILSAEGFPDFAELIIFNVPELTLLGFAREMLLRRVEVIYGKDKKLVIDIDETMQKDLLVRKLMNALLSPYKKITYKGEGEKVFTVKRKIMKLVEKQ